MKNYNNKVGDYTITSFVYSKKGKQLSNKRALYHIKDRLIGYDVDSDKIYQVPNPPISVALCPTSICVRSCEFCSNTNRNRINSKNNIMYSESIFRNIINDLNRLGVRGVSIAGGGEPLTYPQGVLYELLANKENTFKIGLHTNGVLLDRILTSDILYSQSIDYINVSVIAHTPSLYSKVCGADEEQFKHVENNLKLALKYQKQFDTFPTFGVKVLLSRSNYKYVSELYSYFYNLGITNILLRCVGNFEENQDVELYDNQKAELINILKGSLHLTDKQINGIVNANDNEGLPIPSRCWINALQYTAGIDPDGKVFLCSQWSREGFEIGNVNEKEFIDIWNSERHAQIVEKLNCKLKCGECSPLSCRHYYTNLAIDAYVMGMIPALEGDLNQNYGRFI